MGSRGVLVCIGQLCSGSPHLVLGVIYQAPLEATRQTLCGLCFFSGEGVRAEDLGLESDLESPCMLKRRIDRQSEEPVQLKR